MVNTRRRKKLDVEHASAPVMPVNCTLNFHTFLAPTLLPPNQALQFLSLHSRHLLPIKPLSIHTPLPYPFFPRFESQTLAPKIPDLGYTDQTMSENRLSSPLVFNPRASGNDIKISSLTIVVAAIFLFLTVIFVFLLYFYAKYYWGSRSTRRRARFIVAGGNPPVLSQGLDPTVLSSIPITLYKPSDFKDGLECAVCLSELASGEEARLLPKCNHGFHLECIDTWFQSHSTCPICRCTVGPEAVEDDGNRSDLPTNVLFWGNHNQVNTRRLGSEEENSGSSGSSEGALVISIPNRSAEGLFSTTASPLPTRRSQVEEMKSPVENKRSPATPNMWSLRRILSMGKRAGGSSSSSPRTGDVEQGLDGSGAENGEGSSRNPPKNSL